jgi:SAM-dependent methyltransferase
MARVEHAEVNKIAEIESRTPEFMEGEATKPFGWEPYHWIRWSTIVEAMRALDIQDGARVLDIGVGTGWTSIFLAQAGYDVTAIDLVPANIEMTERRAAQWGVEVTGVVADMDEFALDAGFDFVLIYDALHHSNRQRIVLEHVSEHLRPGGWVFLGETTWLHRLSPSAHRHSRDRGWVERGFTVRGLRSDLEAAGLSNHRRFFQGTHPYETRARGFAFQLACLVGANFLVAPRTPFWLAAQKPLAAR